MARVELIDPLKGLHGKLDKNSRFVFRQNGGVVSCYVYDPVKRARSAKQKAWIARNSAAMREAAAIVRDPARWSAYEERWEREGRERYSKPRYWLQAVLLQESNGEGTE